MDKTFLKDAEKRTFLVTGASGFLGKEIVRFALDAGAKVVAADYRISPKLEEQRSDRLRLWQIDLTSDFKELPAGITDVIHAAGRVSDWGKYEDFYNINVGATEKLIQLAKIAGVKNFLYISSIDIHGFFGHVEETEDGIYYPSKCFYPVTKTISEKAVRAFDSPEMKTVCIRPCTVYGPGDTTVQGPMMDAILKGQMGYVGGKKHLISRVYITDLVQGLYRALEFGKGGDAYNIVSGEKITWKDWVDEISKNLGVPSPGMAVPYFLAITLASAMEGLYKLIKSKKGPILTRMRIQHAGHDFYFVPTKAKKELGFAPEVPWQEGVARMVQEYKKQNHIK